MMKNFFAGLKVIELASVLAGPAVGQFFAELGADVLKIENKTTSGDVTRRWKLPSEDKDHPYSAYYASVNYGKRIELMDLSQSAEKNKLLEWIKSADIIISNFKEHSAKKLALHYDQIKLINPNIIYAQLHAFGSGINRPAFDVVLQAEAGFLYMTGHPGQAPAKMPVALIDLLAAHQLKEGILLGLLHREKSGKGCLVSTSLLESAVASLANQATNWLMEGFIPQPMGTAHPNIAPYGDIFVCKDDKSIIIAAGTEKQFKNLCVAIGMNHLAENDKFNQNSDRVEHRLALNEYLAPFFKTKNRSEIARHFQSFNVPYGEIVNMKELFEKQEVKHMILDDSSLDDFAFKSVRTVAFNLKM